MHSARGDSRNDLPAIVDLWIAALCTRSNSSVVLLSSDELARAERFQTNLLRDLYISRRSTLRQILCTYANIPARNLVFQYGLNGKPFLPGRPHLHFNTSHSHQPQGLLVCAVCLHFEIGVDIEHIRPIEDLKFIVRHFFAPAEQARLAGLAAAFQMRSFFECWTRKEAVIKATGEGITRKLDSFEVSFGPNVKPKMLRFEQDDSPAWHIESFEPAPGYVGAIASRSPWRQLRIRTFRSPDCE